MQNMSKLTEPQKDIIRLMKSGWQLGKSRSMFNRERAWLQYNGIGKGGESKQVNKATFEKLRDNGLIEQTDCETMHTIWELTEEGLKIN